MSKMDKINDEQIKLIGQVLNNPVRPLKERFRALFTLRNLGGPVALKCIEECFRDDSALLKHELAYCLGQMQDEAAIPILTKILEDRTQEPMVRHEAAEALGAIGSQKAIPVLEKYVQDHTPEVSETCELALGRIKWVNDNENDSEELPDNPYCSVDPTPPAPSKDVDELKDILLNERISLYDRYRAMFALRNLRTEDAVLALCSALKCGSALFRHEIAFVLGQMQQKISVPFLREALENPNENEMVRHECAEALGAIASDHCLDILNKYLSDEKRVVKESCEIALDMCDYENSPEFQYANTLGKINANTFCH